MSRHEYYKPNMANLRGRMGRSIYETIMNTPKPDLTELERKANEVERRVLEERRRKSTGAEWQMPVGMKNTE